MRKPDPVALAAQVAEQKLPPVDLWNPPLSGDMDLRITRQGQWLHEGTLIQREGLVRLFSTILRRDEDGHYYLVTPVEKWRIHVEEAPFLAVLLERTGSGHDQQLCFITNVGDRVVADQAHPIEVEYTKPNGEPTPLIPVRARLKALIARPVFLELIDLAEAIKRNGKTIYRVWSQGIPFELGTVDETDESFEHSNAVP